MTDQIKPTLPMIHLGGTSKQALLDGYCNVGRAIMAAMTLAGETVPNGRDYSKSSPGTFENACREHEARLTALRAVYDQYAAIVNGIDELE